MFKAFGIQIVYSRLTDMRPHTSDNCCFLVVCLFLCNPVVLLTITPILCLLLVAFVAYIAAWLLLLHSIATCYSSLCFFWHWVVPYFCKSPHRAIVYSSQYPRQVAIGAKPKDFQETRTQPRSARIAKSWPGKHLEGQRAR